VLVRLGCCRRSERCCRQVGAHVRYIVAGPGTPLFLLSVHSSHGIFRDIEAHTQLEYRATESSFWGLALEWSNYIRAATMCTAGFGCPVHSSLLLPLCTRLHSPHTPLSGSFGASAFGCCDSLCLRLFFLAKSRCRRFRRQSRLSRPLFQPKKKSL
jgi:hypothetical protein